MTSKKIMQEILNIFRSQKIPNTFAAPFFMMLCTGIPLLVGSYFNHLNYALLASLGTMVFLYTPNTNLMHSMSVLFCCSYGLILCFLLGVFANLYPQFIVLFVFLVATLVTCATSYFNLPPPGNYFFIMSFSISAFMPLAFAQNIQIIGFVFMGTTLACIFGFIYNLYQIRKNRAFKKPQNKQKNFSLVITDSVITGFVVALSIFIAIALNFSRPYWVGILALGVLRGISYYIVVSKLIKRLIGTIFGLVLTMYLLSLHENMWVLSIILMIFVFIGYFYLSKNLLIAIIFLTPLSIFFAEIGNFHLLVDELIKTRFYDTLLGGSVGVIGGYLFHWKIVYNKIDLFLKKYLMR